MQKFERPLGEAMRVEPRAATLGHGRCQDYEMPFEESCRHGVELSEKTGCVGCRKQKWRGGDTQGWDTQGYWNLDDDTVAMPWIEM